MSALNVLLYGSGAREHAIAAKLLESTLLNKLFLAKPNDGFANLGEVLEFKDFCDLAQQSKQKDIALLVVGPENPLEEGIVDEFKKVGIKAIGPNKFWAQLESSKSFAKTFMKKNGINTSHYSVLEKYDDAESVLADFEAPFVIKADGLCAGKGVAIVDCKAEAMRIIKEFLDGKFAVASKKIIVEEYQDGDELSLMSLWDGKTLLSFVPARDFKKLYDSPDAPNTGGMASFCPVRLNEIQQEQLSEYSRKLETALIKENADFCGVVYSGLIVTNEGIKVLEYNVRFGDPETQSLMELLKNDLLELFVKAANQQLDDVLLEWDQGISACLTIAAKGYPFNPKKGSVLKNIDEIKNDVTIYFAGVKKDGQNIISNGGRVLSLCQKGPKPFDQLYKAAQALDFDDKYFIASDYVMSKY